MKKLPLHILRQAETLLNHWTAASNSEQSHACEKEILKFVEAHPDLSPRIIKGLQSKIENKEFPPSRAEEAQSLSHSIVEAARTREGKSVTSTRTPAPH